MPHGLSQRFLRISLMLRVSTFKSIHSSGVGVVIHDFAGTVEATLSKNIPYLLGPLEIEAKALEEGFFLHGM